MLLTVRSWLLFASSWSPTWVMWAILAFPQHVAWTGGLLVFTLLSLFVLIKEQTHICVYSQGEEVRITRKMARDRDVWYYTLSYIVAFLVQPWQGWEQLLLAFLLFLIAGGVCVNGDLLYLNPMFALAGFHLYEVDVQLEQGQARRLLLARGHFHTCEKLYVVACGDLLIRVSGKRR